MQIQDFFKTVYHIYSWLMFHKRGLYINYYLYPLHSGEPITRGATNMHSHVAILKQGPTDPILNG